MSAENSYHQMNIMEWLQSRSDHDTWFGKTSAEPIPQTEEKISEPSLKKPQKLLTKPLLFLNLQKENGLTPDVSWDLITDGALLGVHMTLNFGEYPNEERESHLSQILQAGAHQRYFLSEKACRGILSRAERRGKELPAILKSALERQALMVK